MDQVRGVADLGVFRVLGQPNLNIKVDRDKAARYGLNTGDVNTVVQAALGGTVATTQLEAERQFNVTVRLAPEYRGDFTSVGNIKVGYTTPNGTNAYIPLQRARRPSRSIPAPPTSSTSATPASFRSSSACAAAISARRSPRRRSGSPRT